MRGQTARVVVRWAYEQWCHGHPMEVGPAPTVIDVVVPRSWTESVIKEAERFCREAATEVAQ